MTKKTFMVTISICLSFALHAQNNKGFATKGGEPGHESSQEYEWPTDPKVVEHAAERETDRKANVWFYVNTPLNIFY